VGSGRGVHEGESSTILCGRSCTKPAPLVRGSSRRITIMRFRPANIRLINWPRSWMGLEKDLPPGEELVVCFRPFIEHLAASSLSSKTIRRHVDNLWILGGEIIRDLNYTPSLGKVAATSSRGGSCRRRPTDPQRLGRGAALPRCDLPQTPPLPQSTSALNPPVTHRFPRRGNFKYVCFSSAIRCCRMVKSPARNP
jgi:hypothetical protein